MRLRTPETCDEAEWQKSSGRVLLVGYFLSEVTNYQRWLKLDFYIHAAPTIHSKTATVSFNAAAAADSVGSLAASSADSVRPPIDVVVIAVSWFTTRPSALREARKALQQP